MTFRQLPIVMYHSVGHEDPGWLWNELICPVDLFRRQLSALEARGYRAATLDDVRDARDRRTIDSARRVVLTFDDGYLDNWVYVYPLLKRAGWKGVVYVNPEFVDPGEELRPNLEDVWSGRCPERDLQTRGFLNWAEIGMLDRSGVLEIASHSMSHTWYPIGAEIVDFHRPGLATPWLAWNARPERKPFYLAEDQSTLVPWGTPIHRSGRSLGVRRYLPDPGSAAAARQLVADGGGADFFARPDWRLQLEAAARAGDGGTGRLETDEEMEGRFEHEILGSLRELTTRLGRPVRHFCWPGGAYCDASWAVADRAELGTVTVRRGDPGRGAADDPRFIRRISDYRQYSFRGRTRLTGDAGLLVEACDVELGLSGAKSRLRARKLAGTLGFRNRTSRSEGGS